MTPQEELIYMMIKKGHNTRKKLMILTNTVGGTVSNHITRLELQGMIYRVKKGLYEVV